MRRRIKTKISHLEHRGPRTGPAPHHRTNARRELRETEGLRQVVVGARVETPHPILGGLASREHEHRSPALRFPEAMTHLEPVHTRQHDVQHDRVVIVLGSEPQPVRAVERHVDRVPLLPETTLEQGRHPGLVLDHQHPHTPERTALLV